MTDSTRINYSEHEVCRECGHDFMSARIDSNTRLMILKELVRTLSIEWEKDPNSDGCIEAIRRLEAFAGVDE